MLEGLAAPQSPLPLRRNRNFRNFLIARALSALGDSFAYVALPLLVLQTTHSVFQMGLVTAVSAVASIFTGFGSGLIADRVNRRLLLMICDIARCILYATIPLVWLFSPELWLIYLVVALASVFSNLFSVTYVTAVPAIVEPSQITLANGRLYASYAIAGVAGPALAGLISGLYGPSVAIGVDAASFAVSAAGALLVKLRPIEAAPDSESTRKPGARGHAIIADFLAGVRFLWNNSVLRTLTVLLSIVLFLTTGLTDLIVYDVEHTLRHSDSTVGYVLAAGTVGTFIGAAFVARIRKRLGFSGAWISSLALAGAAIACLGVARSIPVVGALAAVVLMCMGVAGICSMSLRQEITPDYLLGRVTAAFWTIQSSLGPLGAALLTAVAAGYGVSPVFFAIGGGMVLIALSTFRTPIWPTRKPADDVT